MGKAQPYSIWPVVLMNYNIPPWMSMKKGHLILSMLIPGPKQPTNLNVYMAPLLEELKKLWRGVPAYDNRKLTGGLPRSFDLCGILLWTMHDYPGNFDYQLNYFYEMNYFVMSRFGIILHLSLWRKTFDLNEHVFFPILFLLQFHRKHNRTFLSRKTRGTFCTEI